MVNGYNMIYIEQNGKLVRSSAAFTSEEALRRIIERIVSRVGRRIDESSPLVDARLADGSRVNAIIPPLAFNGSSLTIRKFAKDPFKVDDLIGFGTLTADMAELLQACVEARLNIIVSGGTGSGKTTLLNVLSSFIPEGERIVTIEDAVELQLQQDHVVRLESRPPNIEGKGEVSIRDLVRNSLRMRPDRIVVGEVRGGECLDMLQAMNTGHDGSLSTVHANSPRDAIARLETLVLMAGMDLPLRAIREQIASAIDLIIQLSRLRDGTRRVTFVTEVQGMEGQTVTLQDAFLFDYSGRGGCQRPLPGRADPDRRPAALHRPVRRAGHRALPPGVRCADLRVGPPVNPFFGLPSGAAYAIAACGLARRADLAHCGTATRAPAGTAGALRHPRRQPLSTAATRRPRLVTDSCGGGRTPSHVTLLERAGITDATPGLRAAARRGVLVAAATGVVLVGRCWACAGGAVPLIARVVLGVHGQSPAQPSPTSWTTRCS